MARIIALALLGLFPLLVGATDNSNNTTVIGSNVDLVEGYHAMLSGDYEYAVEKLKQGIKATPNNRDRAKAYSNLCAGYTILEQYELAVESCNQSLDLQPRSWHALNNRALALMFMDRLAEAEADVNDAMKINPDAPKLQRTREILLGRLRIPRVTIEDHT
ncbi:MAG: tetratricopeptide repeat protein [Pseudomonadota bacterium]